MVIKTALIIMARAKSQVPMDGLYPREQPQKRLIESLLWHLHFKGIGCAVSGVLPTHQPGRFKQLLFAGPYIAICEMPESETYYSMAPTLSISHCEN